MSLCPPTFRAERVFCVIPTLATPQSANLRLGTSGGTGLFLAMITRPYKLILRLHRTPYTTPQLRTCRRSAAWTSRQPNRSTTIVVRQIERRRNELRLLARFDRVSDLTSPSFSRCWTACGGCEFAQ